MTRIGAAPPAEARTSMDGLWIALTDADASADAHRLARLAWELYGRLGEAVAAQTRLRAAVHGLACRAPAVATRSPHRYIVADRTEEACRR